MLSEVSYGSFIGALVDSLHVCFMHERSENVYHSMKSMSPLDYYIDGIMKTFMLVLHWCMANLGRVAWNGQNPFSTDCRVEKF